MNLRSFLLILLFIPNISKSQNSKFDEYYKKATVATFYSSTVFNSYSELNVALKYLDSAKMYLDVNSSSYQKESYNIATLEEELKTSKSIAEDNLNYRIPGFSIITNKRDDINLIDDAQELLLEYLAENHLSQADPLLKGNINDNTHYFLINISPFNQTLLGVMLDFLSLNSGHYAIRPHEISAILGDNGFQRFKNDTLSSDDYIKILNHYNINRLYNLTFEDKGSILDKLYYWGATLNTIDLNNPKKTFWKYFENFKRDKRFSYTNSLLICLLCLFLSFIFLRVYDVKKYKNLKISSFTQSDYLLNDLILISVSLFSIGLCFYLGSFISPDVNIFYGEIIARIWIVFQVFGFPLIIFIILLLASLKFGKIATTSIENLSKILYLSFGFPYLSIIIVNQFSAWEDVGTFYEAPIILALLIIPSQILANSFLPIIRGKGTLKEIIIFLMGIILFFWSQYELLSKNYTLSNFILFTLIILLISIRLFIKSKISSNEKVLGDQKKLLIDSKLELIDVGFNYEEYIDVLNRLLESETDQLLNVVGTNGIAKQRIAKKTIENQKINLFEIDFSNIEANYESFKICFKEKNNILNLSENFFSSPISFKKLSQSLSTASDFLPINILKSININDDDELISAREIAADLINTIIEQSQKESCLLVSNINSISLENWTLFYQFLIRLNSKRNLNKFKIIILSENDFYDHKEDILQIFDGKDSEINVYCNDLKASINEFIKSMSFSNQLNEFILTEVAEINQDKFSIGKVINLLNDLNNDGYLNIDSNKIGLINQPSQKYKLENDLNFFIGEYNQLDNQCKTIIESASLIGNEFDVNLLSNILNIDTLELLSILEKLEKIGLISDDLNNVGVFNFQSNIFHKWLIENIYNNEKKSTQRTLEIQKRLIESLILHSKTINLKILKNCIQDLLKIKNPKSLTSKFEKLLLISIDLFAKNNHFNGIDLFLIKYLNLTDKISNEDLNKIISILNKTIQSNGSLLIFEKKSNSNKTIIDELIFDFYKNASNEIIQNFFEIILKDIVRRSREISNNTILSNRLIDIKNKIETLKINSLRIEFYQLKIDVTTNKNQIDFITQLEDLANKSVIQSKYQLASEIYRDLSIQYRNQKNQSKMLKCILNSLNYFFDKPLNIDVNTSDFNQISKIILDFLTVKQTKEQAENLSYTINRLMENLSMAEKFENVFELSNYNIALNQKIKDHHGVKLSFLHRGKSLFKLNKFNESLVSYKEQFDYLSDYFNLNIDAIDPSELNPTEILATNSNYWIEDELTPILEGVLFNCKELKDYSFFYLLKEELYKNNIIISSKILDNNLFWYDENTTIRNLIPEIKKYDQPNKFSTLLIQAFLLLSKSDGEIVEEEFYNSVEYSNALQLITNESLNNTKEQFIDLFNKINGLDKKEISLNFKKTCQELHDKFTIDTYKRFYFSLLKISYSDFKLFKEEIALLKIAKSIMK